MLLMRSNGNHDPCVMGQPEILASRRYRASTEACKPQLVNMSRCNALLAGRAATPGPSVSWHSWHKAHFANMGSRPFRDSEQLVAANGQSTAGAVPCRYSCQDAPLSAGHLALPIPAHAGCACSSLAQDAQKLEAAHAGPHHTTIIAGMLHT